ncbi:MAG: hypothetical protein GC136_03470 [Alphaproteobacteria bacterium]|nr:hypothetical protein [Alphaproteobacteria bacterium]
MADVAGDQVVKAESFTRWYYAARAGDSEAQYQLGKSLCCGKRPLHNSYDALKWFCSAARQGQRDAILEVGRMYEKEYQREGSQMPKDDALAYAYYSKAAERDSEAAASMLSSLHWRISERDLKQAKEYIQKWPDIPCEIN